MSVITPWTRDTMINHRSDFDLWSSVTAKPIKLILLIVAMVVVVAQLLCEYCPPIIYYSASILNARESCPFDHRIQLQTMRLFRVRPRVEDHRNNVHSVSEIRRGQDTLMELIFSNKSSKCGPNVIICRWRAKCASIREKGQTLPLFLDKETNCSGHWMDPEKQLAIDLILSILIYVDHVYSSQSVSRFPATASESFVLWYVRTRITTELQ